MHMADNKHHRNEPKKTPDKSGLIWKTLEETSTPEELERFKELSRLVEEHNKRVLQKWKRDYSD